MQISKETDLKTRYHGLDALRGISMILGIALHSTLPYIPNIEVIWPADRESSNVLWMVFEFIHIWRMPLFFLLAGFFANLVVTRRSWLSWWINRSIRLLIPMVIFFPLLGLTIPWIFEYGRTGEVRFFYSNTGQPFHLWFLWHLLIFTLLTIILRPLSLTYRMLEQVLVIMKLNLIVISMGNFKKLIADFIFRPRIPVLFIAIYCVVGIPTGGELILNPISGALYFTLGYSLYGNNSLLSFLNRYWIFYLSSGVIFFIIYGLLITFESTQPKDLVSLIKILLKAICSILFSFGFIGLAENKIKNLWKWPRFISDSSYWMYLIHLPIVTFLTFVMFEISISPLFKFFVSSTITLLVCLITYKYFVRHTLIGTILNGKRSRTR
tara:strand:+ start:28187 stop:29329 length:1143 start_codon:yes stop_codon:yes gene_type:complete